MEVMLNDLRRKLNSEKSLRNKVLLRNAISALEEYERINKDDSSF